jgi:hypothetical protein
LDISLDDEEYRIRVYGLFDEVMELCEKRTFSLNNRDGFAVVAAALLPVLAGGLVDAMREDKGRWPTVDEAVEKFADKPDRVCVVSALKKRGAPAE